MSQPSVPTVSVCIASYNYENYIGEAIESVLRQSYTDWELIIVDDASPDNSAEVIQQYQARYPEKIRFIPSEQNRGPGRTFNHCMELAQGRYIAFLGSDDRMLPARLEKQVAFMDAHPDVGALCTDVVPIDSEGKRMMISLPFSKPIIDLRLQLLDGNFLNAPSAMVRATVLEQVGLLNPVLQYVQDFDHWLRMLESVEIVRLDEKLTEYRIHGQNLSIQNAGDQAYAGAYETVVSVLRAINTRNTTLNTDDRQRDPQQLIEKKLQLAEAAVNIEKKYLQELRFAAVLVYLILLEVLELDPECERALSLLSQVYEALGDQPRSEGGKPIRVAEYIQRKQQQQRGLEDSPLAVAKRYSELSSQSLPNALNNMLSSDLMSTMTTTEKESILNDATETLINDALKHVDYLAAKTMPAERRQDLDEFLVLLNKQTDDGHHSAALSECKQQVREVVEQDEYQTWILKHQIREVDAEILAERMMLHWHVQPVIHCFMFVLPGEEALLADTVDSLAGQLTKSWQLTVVAGTPAPDPVFEQADFLHWRTLQVEEDPYAVMNQAISQHVADWIMVIEPGMQFSPHSLLKIADAINLNPACNYFYTDDDAVDDEGVRRHPRFKPDFNLDLLRASPYLGHGIMQGAALVQMGGVNAVPGLENYDLALRWVDIFGESAFCHIADVLIHCNLSSARPFDKKAGEAVLAAHFERRQLPVDIAPGYVENSFRVEYRHQQMPMVSIIIPTKDKLEYLQPCVESLLEKTNYPHYEVLIVDNQSTEPDTHLYYQQLVDGYDEKVRVLHYDKPFNFSDMNNWAVGQAKADYVLLLNNDTEVIQPDWLSRLMNHGLREDVGVVGARLVYPGSGKLQHAGVYLGIGQIADHPYNQCRTLNESSHMERARLDQNLSAVTAAVMLVKKSVYQRIGGMDADNLKVLFNDVDLCLRVIQAGYRVVWTPFSIVVHHGSVSLKSDGQHSFYHDWAATSQKAIRTKQEQEYMLKNWLPMLANDPCYNKNLSLRRHEFNIDLNAPHNWEIGHHLRLRCFGVPINGGSGEYRMKQPFSALAKAGLASCEIGKAGLTVTELARLQADTVVFQNAISDKEMDLIRMYKNFMPQTQIIFLLDDLLHDLPEKSSQYKPLKAAYRDARSRLRRALSYCDRLIVSTEPLRELCQDMIDDIEIVPNRLEAEKWLSQTSYRNQSDKPRVGWAGAQQHQGDLELIAEVVKETAEEVDWIFFGMCPDDIKPYIAEEHRFVPIEDYPAKLASLNLDLAIAPLEQHDFNRAKSNLRLLEYGAMGWPVICSDIYPYQTNDAPVIRVQNEKTEWVSAIRQILADPDALEKSGHELRQWVREHYILEDHLNEWLEALKPLAFQPGMHPPKHLASA